MTADAPTVRQLRLVIQVDDFEAATAFYRDVLGLSEQAAFEVDDSSGLTARLSAAGATVIAEPIETPWRSLNSRLLSPDGTQVTLFEELESMEERSARPGFTQ